MGFTHVTVAKLVASTPKVIERLVGNDNDSRFDFGIVDGIYVRAPLAEFCNEIRRTNKHVKFGVKSDGRLCVGSDGTSRVAGVWMYYDGDQYAIGRVSVPNNTYDVVKYMAYAHTIKNGRYSGGGDDYYTVSSTQLDRALKNVRKYLRKYTPRDVAGITRYSFADKITDITWNARQAMTNAKTAVTDDALIRELRNLLNINHTFLDVGFREKVAAYIAAVDEVNQQRTRQVHGLHVAVSELDGAQTWTLVHVNDLLNDGIPPTAPVETYTAETVPADVMEKVVTLNLVENEHFVEGLGMKVSDTVYWVLK